MTGAAESPAETRIGRRALLGFAGLTAAGVLGGARIQEVLDRLLPGPDGALASLLPAQRFRIYSVTGTLPARSPDTYRLRIGGLVARPLDLTLHDLRARPAATLVRDFQCVTGWRVGAVRWGGARLSTLLDEAGAAPGAAVEFRSFDGRYTEALTAAQARRADVVVAYEMNGRPLSSAHGGPARLYVAPMYGYKSCKWLGEITVTDRPVSGFWEQRGYDADGWVGRSNGRDDRPT
ncbi:MAG TPA: molybdopterin-dependent oxidoreductase [Acidimicrobiia bacterium]|nr:molybdopterin-dependent oxidoreductase [Acidimicrobiia bacterium]